MAKMIPPPWNVVGKHDVFPKANHDEIARYNFLTNMNIHLSNDVLPGVKEAYEQRALPKFERENGEPPQSRQDVRKMMEADPFYQTWSNLRRNTMEMRQQNGRSIVYRQWQQLVDTAKKLNDGADTLKLNPAVEVPHYVRAVDIHCMPGCYYTEYCEDDISVGANYDSGLFVTTAGMLGKMSDGGGQAIVNWLKGEIEKGFKPKRILDMGCTVGHNIVPLAQAFPDIEIVAIDVAAPILRYAHARAKSMGVNNITFMQADAANTQFEDGSFDVVITCMFLHELSAKSLPKIVGETHRLLSDGGKVLHVEQPQYTAEMPLYEQFMRDWDTYNNNEPFWGAMHDIDMFEQMEKAGFARDQMGVVGLAAVVDETLFPSAAKSAANDGEDYGRKPVWNVYVATK